MAERVYALTKDLVFTGELPGGHLFSEGEIAERAGVSRTPVREALLRLQSEGFIRLIPKRGAIVVPISPNEAEDVLDARQAVETAAVRRLQARAHLLPSAMNSVRAALAEQQKNADSGDITAFAKADEYFHRSIVEAGGNDILIGFYTTLSDRQQRMSARTLHVMPTNFPIILREHGELIDLIESGEFERFSSALSAHLDRFHRS